MTQYLYSKLKYINIIYNIIIIIYDYRYYCDFNILFNLVIQYITGMYSVFGTHVRIQTPCVIIRTVSQSVGHPIYHLINYILLMNQSDKLQLHYL